MTVTSFGSDPRWQPAQTQGSPSIFTILWSGVVPSGSYMPTLIIARPHFKQFFNLHLLDLFWLMIHETLILVKGL